MNFKFFVAALAAGVVSSVLAVQPASAGGFGSETYPVPTNNSVVFFNGGLGGEGDLTVNGTPYAYDPSDGNLVMEVIATDQDNICNCDENGFMLADYTGSQVVRAVSATNVGVFNGTGALVTTFNGGLNSGQPRQRQLLPV